MNRPADLAFFEESLAAFAAGAARVGQHEHRVRIGPHVWRLMFAGREFRDRMFPACRHIDAGPAPPAWTVYFFDSRVTGVPMPSPPWSPEQYKAGGELGGYESGRFRIFFQPTIGVLRALDNRTRTALYWVPDLAALPWWETSFPLRTLIHWAYADTTLQPLHAGAVGLDSGGVLLAGPSGSGKSTSTLSCLDSNLRYAGDDYVLVDSGPEPAVYSLYCTAKLEPGNLQRLPFLQPWLANGDRLDREKAMVFLDHHRPASLITRFPLKAILLPKVTGERDTLLVTAPAAEAMHAIAQTCLIHLPYHRDALLKKVGRISRGVPVYRLLAGTDLRQIPERIQELLERLG